jgi:hypothetical protein
MTEVVKVVVSVVVETTVIVRFETTVMNDETIVDIDVTVEAVKKVVSTLLIKMLSVGTNEITTPEGWVITDVPGPAPGPVLFDPAIVVITVSLVLIVAVPTIETVVCPPSRLAVIMMFE